jgi:hypothetical protein
LGASVGAVAAVGAGAAVGAAGAAVGAAGAAPPQALKMNEPNIDNTSNERLNSLLLRIGTTPHRVSDNKVEIVDNQYRLNTSLRKQIVEKSYNTVMVSIPIYHRNLGMSNSQNVFDCLRKLRYNHDIHVTRNN